MPAEKQTEGRCLPCKGCETRDWYAWINLMPPPPDELHVVGEVQVPNPGVEPLLVPKEPQGINPKILLLDLLLVQQPGIWPQVLTWKQARYGKVVRGEQYTEVEVFCDGESIASATVEIVH